MTLVPIHDYVLLSNFPSLVIFFSFRYVYQRNDKPSMTLTIPQPEGTTHWKLGLQMDTNVEELGMRTSEASRTFLDSYTIELRPLSNHEFTDKTQANITLEFFFDPDKVTQWETNGDGEIPRWRYPCIAKILTCHLNDNQSWTDGNFTVLLTILVGIMVGLSCCAACLFCTLKAKITSNQMVERSTESTPMEGWRTPEVKYQPTDQRFKQRINTIFND